MTDTHWIFKNLVLLYTAVVVCSIYFPHVNIDSKGYKHTTLKARVNPMLREKV